MRNVSYNTFLSILREEMEPYDCLFRKVQKNNNTTVDCITKNICEGSNLSKVVYVRDVYENHLYDDATIEDIINEILAIINSEDCDEVIPLIVNNLMNFEAVKDRVVFYLINKDMNSDYLKDVPCRDFIDDFSIVYKLDFSDLYGIKECSATVSISNSLINKWDVEEGDLFDLAMRNTPILRKSYIDWVENIVEDMIPECVSKMKMDFQHSMIVVTNEFKRDGAAVLLYEDTIKHIQSLIGQEHFYVIPSSVNEMLIIKEVDDLEDLNFTINSMNHAFCSQQEILGYYTFYFNGKTFENLK